MCIRVKNTRLVIAFVDIECSIYGMFCEWNVPQKKYSVVDVKTTIQVNYFYIRGAIEWEYIFLYLNTNTIDHELGIYMLSGNGWDIK